MTDKKAELPSGFIDLGEKDSECCMPPMMSETDDKETIHYPSLYFSGKEKLAELPESGTAIIHYRKRMESNVKTKTNGVSKTRYTLELEIHGIKAGESDKEEEAETSDEDAIETGLKAAAESKED